MDTVFRDTFVVPLRDSGSDVAIYAPLRGVALRVSQASAGAWSRFLLLGEQSVAATAIAGELARHPEAQLPTYDVRAEYQPTHVSLALSLRCNLACSYCHASSVPDGEVMPAQLAHRAIDFCFENAKQRREDFLLTFAGGGEPTVEWDLLTDCVEHFHRLPSHGRFPKYLTMATNGVFSKARAEYIADHFSGVSLSLDGPEDIHDAERRTRSGKPTFRYVMATARLFRARGFPFSIRSTVSDRSVHRLTEMIEFFHAEFPGITVGLEPLAPFGRGETSAARPPGETAYTSAFEACLARARKLGVDVVNSGTVKLSSLRPNFCKAVAMPAMVVLADGTLAACERDNVPTEFFYGRYDKRTGDFVVDMEKIRALRSFSASRLPECLHCFCKWHCAGDCTHLRLSGLNRCNTNRRLLSSLIAATLDGHGLPSGGRPKTCRAFGENGHGTVPSLEADPPS